MKKFAVTLLTIVRVRERRSRHWRPLEFLEPAPQQPSQGTGRERGAIQARKGHRRRYQIGVEPLKPVRDILYATAPPPSRPALFVRRIAARRIIRLRQALEYLLPDLRISLRDHDDRGVFLN